MNKSCGQTWRGICLGGIHKLYLRYTLILSSHLLLDLQSDLLRDPSTSFSLIREFFFFAEELLFLPSRIFCTHKFSFSCFKIYLWINAIYKGDATSPQHLQTTFQFITNKISFFINFKCDLCRTWPVSTLSAIHHFKV